MQNDHYESYKHVETSAIRHFYDDPDIVVNIPRPTGWEISEQSFRHLGSDFARRVSPHLYRQPSSA